MGAHAAAPKGSLAFPTWDEKQLRLLRPSSPAGELLGNELALMQTALMLDGVSQAPLAILAKKHFRVRFARGVIGGSVTTSGLSRR